MGQSRGIDIRNCWDYIGASLELLGRDRGRSILHVDCVRCSGSSQLRSIAYFGV